MTVRVFEAHKPGAWPCKPTLDRGLQLRIAFDGMRSLLVGGAGRGHDRSVVNSGFQPPVACQALSASQMLCSAMPSLAA